MDVRIHRFVTERKAGQWNRLNTAAADVGLDHLAVTRQPLKITAVPRVVGMFIHPVERCLRQFQSFRIVHRLICGCSPEEAEAVSIKMLAISVALCDLPPVIKVPKESAILLV